jgi:hypothetical protein
VTTLHLVGCGKAKLAHAAPARELYTGSLFRAAREYVEALGEPWYVVSAEHSVADPDEVLEPYDTRLSDLSEKAKACWRESLALRLWGRLGMPATYDGVTVTLLMGSEYADEIRPRLVHKGAEVLEPLRGLGLGARLAWFKARREPAASGVTGRRYAQTEERTP